MNKILFNLLKKVDNFTMRHAKLLITLNEEMKIQILNRTNIQKEISIIENPSVPFDIDVSLEKKKRFFIYRQYRQISKNSFAYQCYKRI